METGVHFRSDFIAHLASRGISENTRKAYGRDLDNFFSVVLKSAGEIQRIDIQQYFTTQLSQGIGARTLGRRLSTLRTYYGFLLDMESVNRDPTRGVHPPKQPKRLQRAISQQELEALVDSLGVTDPMDLRDRAILLTLYASGLRASELIELEPGDLNLDALTAHVWNGKGSKDGIVPLTPRSADALGAYLAVWNPGTGKLFPFTRQTLWRRVSVLAIEVLGRSISPHRIRAGTATAMLKGGGDIRITQTVLRHASIDTTQLYLDVDPEFMRDCYYKYHPRAVKR